MSPFQRESFLGEVALLTVVSRRFGKSVPLMSLLQTFPPCVRNIHHNLFANSLQRSPAPAAGLLRVSPTTRMNDGEG